MKEYINKIKAFVKKNYKLCLNREFYFILRENKQGGFIKHMKKRSFILLVLI